MKFKQIYIYINSELKMALFDASLFSDAGGRSFTVMSKETSTQVTIKCPCDALSISEFDLTIEGLVSDCEGKNEPARWVLTNV